MGLATKRRTRIVLALLVTMLVAMAVDAVQLWRQRRINDDIQATVAGVAQPAAAAASAAPPALQFAQAYARAASGARDVALNRYRALQGDSALAQAARYNSANVLMRQAIEVRAGPQPGQAIPLIELAKESYRELLRHNPEHWDARYNLERAQRLLPDPEEDTGAPAEAKRDSERAVTTMRGHSPGLP